MTFLTELDSESLAVMAANAIRQAVSAGYLTPGAQLRERELAKEFGVSQNTVREALLHLQNLGLVRRLRNRATYVTELSLEDIRDRIAVRLPLEEIACQEAARRWDQKASAQLGDCLNKIAVAVAADDHLGYGSSDLAFHRVIWERSGNQVLSATLNQITAPLFAFLTMLFHRRHVNLADVAHSHVPIFEALQRGDPELVRRAIRHHIELSYPDASQSGVTGWLSATLSQER